MEENNDRQVPGGELSLKDVVHTVRDSVKFLKGKLKLIGFVAVVSGVIGFGYAHFQEPVYTANLSFVLEGDQTGSGLGGALGLANQFGFDLGGEAGGVFSGGNLIEYMKSRSNVEKALLVPVNIEGKRRTLADFYSEIYGHKQRWENSGLNNIDFQPEADRNRFSRQQDSVLGVFHKALISSNLVVDKGDKKLNIITVKVSSKDEFFSKAFAEVLVEVVSDFYIETKTKKLAQSLAILQHQTDSVRKALNAAISGVATSSDFNPNPNPAMQILRVPSQKRQVDVQANQAILTELVKNLEISKLTLRKETPLIQIVDKPILPLTKTKVSRIISGLVGAIVGMLLVSVVLLCQRFLGGLRTL